MFSWVQEEPQVNTRVAISNVTTTPTAFPRVRCYLPGQAVAPNQWVTVTVKAIVTTDDTGTGTNKVCVSTPETGIYFDAQTAGTGTLQSHTLTLKPKGDGLLRYVEIELSALTAASKKTFIHSVVILWRPGD